MKHKVDPVPRTWTRREATRLMAGMLLGRPAVSDPQYFALAPGTGLDLETPDVSLRAAFQWAKRQALRYVFDGDPVGPWYEAALPGRQAFCMRDTAHQVNGAHALGLAKYNHNMLRRFAENVAASRDWCSYWEIDKFNRPAPVDYKNDREFWYNLPANYDILDACYRMYLWTGDATYIEDPVFLNFYDRTVHDYTERWNLAPDKVMQRTSEIEEPPFFRGDPTYEESSRDNVVGIDLLATQYSAFLAYSAMQAIRGNGSSAQKALQFAMEVKELINRVWWNSSQKYFYAFYTKQHQFSGRAGRDVLYRDVVDNESKTASALETLIETSKTEPMSAVESKSHYAEVLYRYGRKELAYAEILALSADHRERREYPEVSFSVVGALVTGMAGIRVVPASSVSEVVSTGHLETVIETLPQLTANTRWVEIRRVPIRSSRVDVRHDGNGKTRFTNNGRHALRWKAAFEAEVSRLSVRGKLVKASTETKMAERKIAYTVLSVAAGETVAVSTL